MSGMATNGSTGVNNYEDRTFAIEITGVCCQDVTRTSNYSVKVPYNQMSQAIQSVSRMGGKVANVTLISGSAHLPTEAASAPQPKKATRSKRAKKK